MPAERFEFEDFELDRSAYELRRAGTVVHLERIPLELLFVLIERRGQLVTRQEIFERIWGKGVFVDTDNSINTAVNKIRRALNDDADRPRFVVTVPAKGYRFIAPIREESPTAPVPEASPVSAVVEAIPTADAADTSPITITKADMPLRKDRRRGIVSSIVGIALVIAVIVLIQQLSLRGPTTTASIPTTQSPALPLPDKPSIAVLPFTNMSDDREQEYFSDGITDDLITALSRLPDLLVIARTSTFTYKGKAATVQEVSRELGVKYIVEGSVRKAGDHVRITAQLVDATTGAELWAQRYDRPLQDVFALQDEIVGRIVTTLKLQLTSNERGMYVFTKGTENLEAYDDFLRGGGYYWSFTKAGNAKARQMFEKAIELDPKYADAYSSLGVAYWFGWAFQWIQDPGALGRAYQLAQKAVALDESLPAAHIALSYIYLYRRQYNQATVEAERIIALDPNSGQGYEALANILGDSGRPAEAIDFVEKAMRLDPKARDFYLFYEGWIYTQMGKYAEAIPMLKRHLARYPNNLGAHGNLIVDYTELGLEKEAREEAAEVVRISPQFSLDLFMQRVAQKDQGFRNRFSSDQRQAGLK
jgi:TolB-like protein/DNA-binding winged helix-turn-helix (wHTH) protein/Tfp pilus assembly protein PilF